jgi:hypothetical protein
MILSIDETSWWLVLEKVDQSMNDYVPVSKSILSKYFYID